MFLNWRAVRIWKSCCLRNEAKCTYRSVLALDAGAVKTDRGNTLDFALDFKYALIVLLSRLRLGQVPSSQRDWSNDPCRYQDVAARQNLRATLKMTKRQYLIIQSRSKAQTILTHKYHNWFHFHSKDDTDSSLLSSRTINNVYRAETLPTNMVFGLTQMRQERKSRPLGWE